MVIPRITKALTGPVISIGSSRVLVAIEVCIVCTATSTQLMSAIKDMINQRVQLKATIAVQSALMMRVMSLPANFFRSFSAGELVSRSQSVSQLCDLLFGMVVETGISSLMSLFDVHFRYNNSMQYIINNLSLKIKAGEYVAIVGKTGCGKSTLMRLLLGFEKPEKSAIYYNGEDLNSLDFASLRRNIGSVIQNGVLLQGDIFSNIIISAPYLTLKEAWEAAEIAGIAETYIQCLWECKRLFLKDTALFQVAEATPYASSCNCA